MTAVLLVGIVGVLGLSIDVGRIYMVRTGLQNAADAAALAAARELDSGIGGLSNAVNQAKKAALEANSYGLNRSGITVPKVTISKIEFSTSLAANATWYDNTNGNTVTPGVEVSIKYVRVTTQAASVGIIFAAQALGSTHVEQGTATAGMSVGLNGICGFAPVMVALDNTNPSNGALFTLKFTQGTGSSLVMTNGQYAVVQLGNGSSDLATLAAGGIPGNNCYTIGQGIGATSSNVNNGPDRMTDGMNTRFDVFPNGNGSPLQPDIFPPDSNVATNITGTQYLNKSSTVTPPPHDPPGVDGRRVLIMPIVQSQPGGGGTAPVIRGFGAFFLKNKVTYDGQCQKAGHICGDLEVEYLGTNYVIGNGTYDPGGVGSTLTKPVLYR